MSQKMVAEYVGRVDDVQASNRKPEREVVVKFTPQGGTYYYLLTAPADMTWRLGDTYAVAVLIRAVAYADKEHNGRPAAFLGTWVLAAERVTAAAA